MNDYNFVNYYLILFESRFYGCIFEERNDYISVQFGKHIQKDVVYLVDISGEVWDINWL